MNHKEHQIILWLAFTFTLIGVLLLAWPPLLTHVGADLPPRKPPSADQPPDDGDVEPDGAHIILQVPSAPAGVWTVVQWQDSAGGWHDIDGWENTLDEGNKRVWWVAPAAFGTGPFRWLVYQSQGGKLLATSDSFYLADAAGKKLRVEVSLSQ
jgi:hypothetical protein